MGGPRPYALAVRRDDDSLGEEVLVSVDGDPSNPSPADLPDDEHRPLEVPGWLQRLAAISWRTLVVVGMLIVIAVVAVRLSTVTASIIFAGLVAATIAPAYRAVRVDRGWTATKAAVVMSVVALTGLALIATLVVLTFAPFVSEFVATVRTGADALASLATNAGLPEQAVTLLRVSMDNVETWIADAVSSLVGPIAAAVTVVILGGFLTFYVLHDSDTAWSLVIRDLPERHRRMVTAGATRALDDVGAYMRSTGLSAGIDALLAWVYLQLLGVPLAGPLAVTVFLGGFVPYIGPVVAASIVLLVAFATQGFVVAAVVLGLMAVTGIFERRITARYEQQRPMPVHPALVVLALPAGATLFGLIGLAAAVPAVLVGESLAPALTAILDDGRSISGRLVPGWFDRVAQWCWRGLVVFAVAAIAIQAAVSIPGVTIPVVLALIITATLRPVVDRLRARGLGRGQAALTATVSAAVITGAVVVAALVPIAGYLAETVDVTAAGAAKAGLGETPADVVRSIGSGVGAEVIAAFANVVGLAVAILLAMLLTYHLLREGDRWWARILDGLSASRRELLADAGHRSGEVLSGYMIGTGAIGLFAAATQWLIMVLLGLPLALPIGVLTFFGNFIPYIGGAVTTLLGFLVALAVGSSSDIIIMAIYTLVFNIVQGNFVAPLVYGRTVQLHPAVVLLAIPAGGAVAGIIGMFLVVPFLGVVASTWRLILRLFDPDDRSASLTADDRPPLPESSPPAAVPTTAPP
jgi:putative heme transporter